jgi:hypothetical protein
MVDGSVSRQTETGSSFSSSSFLNNEAIQTVLSSLNSLTVFFSSSFSNLPLQELIRLVWIIGGYILLRPYLESGFRRLFATQENDSDTLAAAAAPAAAPAADDAAGPAGDASSPKRGPAAAGPVDGVENVGAGIATGRDVWGAAARNRQAMMRRAWEEEQARLAEEHDLDDIDPDLLED